MKNFILAFIASSSFLTAQEIAPVPVEKTEIPAISLEVEAPVDSLHYKKLFPYGSLSLVNGVGVSLRTRNDSWGRAFDVKAGIGSLSWFGSTSYFQSVALDYNWMAFYSPSESSLYCSWGVGGGLVFSDGDVLPAPLFPFRIGYQFKYGFIDGGVKMLLWVPIPEVRAGVGFEF